MKKSLFNHTFIFYLLLIIMNSEWNKISLKDIDCDNKKKVESDKGSNDFIDEVEVEELLSSEKMKEESDKKMKEEIKIFCASSENSDNNYAHVCELETVVEKEDIMDNMITPDNDIAQNNKQESTKSYVNFAKRIFNHTTEFCQSYYQKLKEKINNNMYIQGTKRFIIDNKDIILYVMCGVTIFGYVILNGKLNMLNAKLLHLENCRYFTDQCNIKIKYVFHY